MRYIYKIQLSLLIPILFCGYMLGANRVSINSMTNPDSASTLSSTYVSVKLYEVAYDLANSDDTNFDDNEIAITFLKGARNLDEKNPDVCSLLLKCLCRFPERRVLNTDTQRQAQFNLLYNLLRDYVDEKADINVATNTASMLLDHTETYVQKKTLIEQMVRVFENRNPAFASRLLTMLGSLKLQNNLPEEAEIDFKRAYQVNKYNKLAFSKLYELSREQITPVEYIERLRLDLRENPTNLQTILAFCQSLEQFQLYDSAAMAYEYCSEVFEYLFPSDTLPPEICIPWSISCYNSNNSQMKCIEIADRVRKTGKFDIRLESLAARAAGKLGQDSLALKLMKDAETKARELIDKKSPEVTEAQLAWFYCFVLPMPDQAMEWANRAFAKNSNSPMEASLLAYALTQEKEFVTAKSIINQFPPTQISDLALAQMQLEEGNGQQGIERLNKAISFDPGSFEAEHAKDILMRNGEKYAPPVNSDFVLASVKNIFESKLIPNFMKPEKMFSYSLNIRKRELSFGSDLESAFSITNNSSEPLVINDDSLFKGYIRIDAIVNGDRSQKFSNLISQRIESDGVIEPGKSKIVNLKLITGQLKEMLLTYPQASLNITFVLYIDPVNISNETVNNGLAKVNPVSVRVARPGTSVSNQGIRNLVNSIANGQAGQKIQSSQLFVSLLKEQQALSGRTTPYQRIFSDGIESMLKSAIVSDKGLLKNPSNGGWIVKVYTMADLVSMRLDYELVTAVSENLYDMNWPVRMMAVYLLAETQKEKFVKVLESISKNDSNQLVKDMASAELLKVHSANW